jgi:protein-tyrosine phosphatase
VPSERDATTLASVQPASVLVVCTANICRSPMVEGLLRQRLADSDAAVTITSAGVRASEPAVDPRAVSAISTFGPDLTAHCPRQLTRDIIRADGADLVITMTRDHLRQVVAMDRQAWPRTFTLRELVRRSSADGDPNATSLREWATALGASRSAREMLRDDPDDDVADPHGLSDTHYASTAQDVDALVSTLVALAPWPRRA